MEISTLDVVRIGVLNKNRKLRMTRANEVMDSHAKVF
jgi:hypothetical protein